MGGLREEGGGGRWRGEWEGGVGGVNGRVEGGRR